MNFLKNLKARLFASQLRKPGFLFGKKVGEQMNKANAYLYKITLNEMKIRDGNRILEIGFGNGKTFSEIFAKANNIEVSGLDYSAEMVKEAKSFNKKLIEAGKLKLEAGSSSSIPFTDNYFDKTFCINVVYFWDEPAQHLNEVLRVLKPNGRFYATIRSKQSMHDAPFTKYGFNIRESAEWKSILEQTGFSNITITDITEPEVIHKGIKYYLHSHCISAQKTIA